MDGPVAAAAALEAFVNSNNNDATDLTTTRSVSPSSSAVLPPGVEDSELIIDDQEEADEDGFPMCGSSFAMGVVAEPARSPTPVMMLSSANAESGDSSVGEDSLAAVGGGTAQSPNHQTMQTATNLTTTSSSSSNVPARRPPANAIPPPLPADLDVLNDDIGDILKSAVLTTIDDLRRRKARPNLKNISHMMMRRHGCSPRQVEALLEFLVERDIVIKVDYKGQASYRNASKWKKGHILKGTIMNPAHISRLVIDVVTELERNSPSQGGVHPDEVEDMVLSRAAQHQVPMNKQKFTEAVTREIDLGHLQKLKSGFLRISEVPINQGNQQNSGSNIISPLSIQRGPPSMVVPSSNRSSLGSSASGATNGATPMKHSPSFRRSPHERPGSSSRMSPPKMAPYLDAEPSNKRQRFMASDYSHLTASPSVASPGVHKMSNLCRICANPLAASTPMRGTPEVTVMCATCRFSVHASCAGYSFDQAMRYRETGWMCPSCRTCTFCGFGPSANEGMRLIVCDQCDRSYHLSCHIPQLTSLPNQSTRWLCSACDLQPLAASRPHVATANPQTLQTPNGSTDRNSRMAPNVSSQICPSTSTPSLAFNGLSNGNSHFANRSALGGLPTPSGSGDSTDEDATGAAHLMPSSFLPAVPAGMSERVADWSIGDVGSYFSAAGFCEQARLVSEQEIDGAALLLLKRDDIIHELGFKLGPALKIYQIIAGLQRKSVLASTCHSQPTTLEVGDNTLATVAGDVLVG